MGREKEGWATSVWACRLSPSLSPKPVTWVFHLLSEPLHPRPLLHGALPTPGPGVRASVRHPGARAGRDGGDTAWVCGCHAHACDGRSPGSPAPHMLTPQPQGAGALPSGGHRPCGDCSCNRPPPLVSSGKFQRLQNYVGEQGGLTGMEPYCVQAHRPTPPHPCREGVLAPRTCCPEPLHAAPEGQGGCGGGGPGGTWEWGRRSRVTGWQRQLWDFRETHSGRAAAQARWLARQTPLTFPSLCGN